MASIVPTTPAASRSDAAAFWNLTCWQSDYPWLLLRLFTIPLSKSHCQARRAAASPTSRTTNFSPGKTTLRANVPGTINSIVHSGTRHVYYLFVIWAGRVFLNLPIEDYGPGQIMLNGGYRPPVPVVARRGIVLPAGRLIPHFWVGHPVSVVVNWYVQ